jgi:glycoside hydrolase-like protein
MTQGIDCALDCTKKVAWLKAAGMEFVGRYYRNSASRWTPLTHGEAQALSEGGLVIVALWESKSDVLEHFSYTAGVDEGTSAYRQAMSAAQPADTPIYFAVDFDCPMNGIAGSINDAIGSGNPSYKVGVYGSGNVCGWLLSHQRVDHTWLAQSRGWGGFQTFSKWSIKQGPTKTKPFDYDTDEATANYGGFVVG